MCARERPKVALLWSSTWQILVRSWNQEDFLLSTFYFLFISRFLPLSFFPPCPLLCSPPFLDSALHFVLSFVLFLFFFVLPIISFFISVLFLLFFGLLFFMSSLSIPFFSLLLAFSFFFFFFFPIRWPGQPPQSQTALECCAWGTWPARRSTSFTL